MRVVNLRTLLMVLTVLSGPAAFADFSYSDFSSVSGLNLVDSAGQSGSALRLTPAVELLRGAAWRSDREYIADGFDTTFTFRMSEPTPPPFLGADGLAFVVQDSSAGAIGTGGLGIGYGFMERSLAIEIDPFINLEPDVNDPAGTHIAVMSRGVLQNLPDHHVAELGVAAITGDLYDGLERSVRVRYLPGVLDVFYDGALAPSISVPVDLADYIGSSDGLAWVGFTAATGAAWGNHDITSWAYQSVPEPATFGLLAVASLTLIRWRIG